MRQGRRPEENGVRRAQRPPGWLAWLAVGLLALAGAPAAAGSGSAAGSGTDSGVEDPSGDGRIELHAAHHPSAAATRRMARWHRVWREEAGPFDRLLGGLGAVDQPAPVGRPGWCRALAEALVAFDRERAFPVPSYAVGRHLRRGLDLLGRGAIACLEGRRYAAAYELRRAQRAFRDAASVLSPYGLAP